MTIQIDSREKAKKIEKIISTFKDNNIDYFVSKLYIGDYVELHNPLLVIDRKHNLNELCANTSDVPKKDANGRFKRYSDGRLQTDLHRFTDELKRAQEHGIKLVILCEHGGEIKNLEDVKKWNNPRLKESPLAVSGERLFRKLKAISNKYDVRFEFCDKAHTGQRIIEILEEGQKQKNE